MLPSFLNFWPAALATAMVVPSLLVLYFLKLRRREVPISSTLLWRKAIQDLQVNAPFQKLRRNLLLFLQLALLLLLCLALARPVVNVTPSAGKMTVLLIDRSASMSAKDVDGHTRLDEAKKRAKEVVASMTRDSMAMVIAFDDLPEVTQKFTTDGAALRNAIDSVQPTDRRSRLKVAYQLAEAQSNFNPEQLRTTMRPDVWLFSDGRVLDAKEVNIRANLNYDRVGTEQAKNIGIVAMSAKRNYQNPAEVQVFLRLANYGTEPVNSDVQLSIAPIDPAKPSELKWQVSRVAGTSLVPERWTDAERERAAKEQRIVARDSVEFKMELATGAVLKVEQMNKEGDQLAADDAAQVVVPPPKTLKVLLVTNGNYFLERVMESLNLQQPDVMTTDAYEAAWADPKKDPSKYDVILFDAYAPKRLPSAGSFIHFGSVPDGLGLKAEKNGDEFVKVEDGKFLDWKRDHPILRHLGLQKVHVGDALKLTLPQEAEVLAEGVKGPLIVLDREGRQTHLIIAFDLWQSDWPVRVSFPVFMQNAMEFLALGSEMGVRESYPPGATPRIPRAQLNRVDENLKELTLRGPTGSRTIPVTGTGDFALPSLNHVGVYTLDPPVPQFEQIAVNLLDPSESNLLPLKDAPGGVGQSVARAAGKSRLELWWWIIACAGIPLLLIEWWVYTRRVHI
jgi:hypothetical protein